ncbi:death domain-associated protein 6-like, partial [Empidonax traillii]|uniref:death domain-associated protein 6-like n=1 Tax=Empidonax traillii TaxID=164674 RepID=UPI000FFCEE47
RQFLSACSAATREHPEVLPFLRSRHARARPEFRGSAEFRNILGRLLRRLRSRRSKTFVYINELCTELKARALRTENRLKRQMMRIFRHLCHLTGEPVEAADDADLPPPENRLKRRMMRIFLRFSPFPPQENRLKRRMMRIFRRLCQLKECSQLTGRVLEQRIRFRGTRYPEVNRRIQRLINRPDAFPDYSDILREIRAASQRHRLGLARRHMESLAQEAFREVGNRLQERRHLDLVYNFGSHLTDEYRPGEGMGMGICRENGNGNDG